MVPRERILRRRIVACAWIIIVGLLLSGLTAIPLQTELDTIARLIGAEQLSPATADSAWVKWILLIRKGLHETYTKFPFIAYGTDWLAFGHITIAIAFIGTLQHPLRNSWLFTFGMIASVLVLPWALIFGELRGIPIYWRLIDCSFGIVGFVPNWLAHRWARELEKIHAAKFAVD